MKRILDFFRFLNKRDVRNRKEKRRDMKQQHIRCGMALSDSEKKAKNFRMGLVLKKYIFLSLFLSAAVTPASRKVHLFQGENLYRETAEHEAAVQGIDREVFLGLIAQESNWNPNARSHSGALGLGQLMPSTARWACPDIFKGPIGDLTNPEKNIKCAARYYRQQLDAFHGAHVYALFAYNAGPGATMRSFPYSPKPDTTAYAIAVFRYAARYL